MMGKFEHECYPHLFPDPKEILCYKQILLEETLVLPCTKPDIESIVDVHTKPIINEYKLINTPIGLKLFIEGRVEQEILYIAKASCQPVHAAHFTISFRTFMLLPQSYQSSSIEDRILPKVLVEFTQAKPVGIREISKCLILLIWCPIIYQLQPAPRPKPSQCHVNCSNNAEKQGVKTTGRSGSHFSSSRSQVSDYCAGKKW